MLVNRIVGSMPGQAGVLGINYTATYPKLMMADSRLMYVNPNHGDATDTGNTGEDPEQPFLTVAAALARCRNNRGDVILVGQNDGLVRHGDSVWNTVIAEEIEINVNGISLIGLNPGGMGVGWNPTTGGTCITVNALDVLIEGFTFFANSALGGTAIFCIWDNGPGWGDNTVIRNCTFTSQVDVGIEMDLSYEVEVSHCRFLGCTQFGIHTSGGAAYLRIHDNLFTDCKIGGGGGGAITSDCDDSMIYRNAVYNEAAQVAAAATDEGFSLSGNNNMVCGNYFSCVLTDAMAAGDWGDFNTGGADHAWPGNWCWNGMAVTTPT